MVSYTKTKRIKKMNPKLINLVDMIGESLYAAAEVIENEEERGDDVVGMVSLRIYGDTLIAELHPRSPERNKIGRK